MLFVHPKRCTSLPTMRLCGPKGAYEQFQPAAPVKNPGKLAKLAPRPASRGGGNSSVSDHFIRRGLKRPVLKDYPDIAAVCPATGNGRSCPLAHRHLTVQVLTKVFI